LERIVQKLVEKFPRVTGLVASVRDKELYLTLEESQRVQPGTRMTVFRKLGAFKHPITGEVLGHFEENLGDAVVRDLRDKFVIARFEPKGEFSPRPGDGVRITAAQIRIALLPVINQTKDSYSQDTLLLDYQALLERTGRFRVFDVDKLQVWFLENRIPSEDGLKPEIRQRLRQFVGTDVVLSNLLRKVGDRYVFESRLSNLVDGKSGDSMTALMESLPATLSASAGLSRGRERSGVGFDEGPDRELDRASRVNPNFRIRKGSPRRGIQRSQKLDWVASGIAVGDMDGDKQQEVAIVHDNQLTIYHWEKGILKEEFSYRTSTGDRFLTVDAIDLDGNGLPEIYITGYRHPNLSTFAMAYVEGKYKVVASNIGAFLRVIEPSRGKPMLVGQALGIEAPFYGPVYEYEWTNGAPEPKRALPLPTGITVYGFNYWDIDGDEIDEIVQISNFGRVKLIRQDGEIIFQTTDRYGGYFPEFRYDQALERAEVRALGDGADADPKYQTIRGRLLLRDVTWDGRPDLVVPINLRRLEFMSNSGLNDAEIGALHWDGSVLVEEWRSRKVGGVVVDYQFADLDGDERPELVAAIVESELLSVKSGETRLVVYKLKEKR
jgi:hypothetical protein